jgi:putative nucleotidyltransferase with HDIG domain
VITARDHQPTLAGLLAMLERDGWVAAHCQNVAQRCAAMAFALGLERRARERLRVAAALHDVGKLLLAPAIVDKPGPLDAPELAVMRTHPELGAQLARDAGMGAVARVILHHHERIDGDGYPAQLRGEDIPIESRTIHVADAFDAMTSDRPYARATTVPVALAEVVAHAGTQFDPDCVAALAATLRGRIVGVPSADGGAKPGDEAAKESNLPSAGFATPCWF